MKKLTSLTAALVIAFALPVFAQEEHKEEEKDVPTKVKLPDPKDMPSKKKPEAKTCADQCRYDTDDCLWMCKSVPNEQGGSACRKACNDTQKECIKGC